MPTKHLTRRELKREDQIHAIIARASSALMGRTSLLLGAVGLVVLIAGGLLLWRNHRQSQDSVAQKEFAEALEVFHGVVGAPGASGAGHPTFASDREKNQKALERFNQLYQRYSSRPVGRLAQYYAALAQQQMQNEPEAVRLLQQVEKEADADVRSLARNALAEIYRSGGKNEQALQVYEAMLKDPESRFPKDALLAAMAQITEALGKNSEAVAYYQRLTREYAQSVYSNDARARLAALNPPK